MGIYLGLYGAIRGIKNAIDISSALTEVQNVVDVTFGDMSKKVTADSRKWSSAESYYTIF